jgi:hypothetical protein
MDQSVTIAKAAAILKSTGESSQPATKKLALVLPSGSVTRHALKGG